RDAWCDPTLTGRQWGTPVSAPSVSADLQRDSITARLVTMLGRRILAIVRGLLANFEGLIPGADLVLLGLTLAGLVSLVFPQGQVYPRGLEAGAPLELRQRWPTFFGIGLLVCGVLANEFVIGRYLAPNGALVSYTVSSIRMFQVIVVLGGLALLMRRSVARAIEMLTPAV